MRHLFATVLGIGMCAVTATAQQGEKPANPEASKVVEFTDLEKSPEAITKGLAQLVKTQKAYRSAPAITEDIIIKVESPMGPQETKIQSTWGPNDSYMISVDEGAMLLTSNGSNVYMELKDSPAKYREIEADSKEPFKSFMEITSGGGLPDPAAGFRLEKSERKPEELAMMLSMAAFANPKVGGFRVTNGIPQVLLVDQQGSSEISFDPKTSLITKAMMSLAPPGAPPGMTLQINFHFNPKLLEKLPKPITFDPGDRTRVSSIEELGPQPVKVGEPAPTFTLASLDGEEVSLADLKGQVVVLDFWATWCGPCKRGLPELQKVADWIVEQKMPVKVYAIDVWENGPVDKKTELVKKFWTDQKFTFPTLLDLDDSVVAKYGLSGIPATFVIGRDGKILQYHEGFDPGMTEKLKKELTEAVQEKG